MDPKRSSAVLVDSNLISFFFLKLANLLLLQHFFSSFYHVSIYSSHVLDFLHLHSWQNLRVLIYCFTPWFLTLGIIHPFLSYFPIESKFLFVLQQLMPVFGRIIPYWIMVESIVKFLRLELLLSCLFQCPCLFLTGKDQFFFLNST